MNDAEEARQRAELQLQIGDAVLYLPEGVYTTVEGYVWHEEIGAAPRILAYRLSCGIAAPRRALVRAEQR